MQHWWFVSYLLLFAVAISFLAYFQTTPAFPDPDSFYHAKMALLIADEGLPTSFPWLQATVLRDSFIDQHLLYHVFLIPFVKLMDPLQGAKFANVLIGTALIVFFYHLLRSQKVKFAFWFSAALLATMPFTFRISLVKAPGFSILLLLVGLYCILKHRHRALFLLSMLYVWAYGGFLLITVLAGSYAFISVLWNWAERRPQNSLWRIASHSHEVKLFLSAAGGVIAGLVINPYFPQNLTFYWHQLVKIGIVNYQNVISVGNEWYPYKFVDLMASTTIVSIILLLGLYLFFLRYRKPTKKLITSFVLFLFFMFITLKSRRYVEYYVPFAIIFDAFLVSHLIRSVDWRELWRSIAGFYQKRRVISTLLIVYVLVMLPTVIIRDVKKTYADFKNGISVHRFEDVSVWLMRYSSPGDVVFHSSWDEFPILFYHNAQNYYTAGLDPTFTYEYSEELYRKMVDITVGTQKSNLHEDIAGKFGASFVFVEANHGQMDGNIQRSPGFRRVYHDDEATIYEVLSL